LNIKTRLGSTIEIESRLEMISDCLNSCFILFYMHNV